jgi:polyhydroxyalkanoate synthesis regulator phasin
MSTYIAGINGVSISSGPAVLINSNGQLGILPSARRYKEQIHDIGDASDGLMSLHPVTFRYKLPGENGIKPLQYGLIAEEVASVYPELVVHRSDGEIESVEYHELPALLLNELQKQHKTIEEQERALARDSEQIEQQRRAIDELERHLKALDSTLAAIRK